MKPTSMGMIFVVATALSVTPALSRPLPPEVQQTYRERIRPIGPKWMRP
jgi:hypothetical protein